MATKVKTPKPRGEVDEVEKLRDEVEAVMLAAQKRLHDLEHSENRDVANAVTLARDYASLIMWHGQIGHDDLWAAVGSADHAKLIAERGRKCLARTKESLAKAD